MNKPAKLAEIRKEVFARAREGLGLSTRELSGMACLSVRQIEQIENGETSAFYGAQIKVTAAKKVAALLKLKEEDAFDFGEKLASAKNISTNDAEQAPAEVKAVAKEVTPESKSKPQLVEITPSPISKNSGPFEVNQVTAQSNPRKKIFILLSIAAAIVFSVVNLRPLFFPEPPKEEVVVAEEVVQEPAPANLPVEEVKSASTQGLTTAEAAAPSSVTAAVMSAECPSADVAVTYKPDAPKKAGDMVYVQSKSAQTICVIDASGKTQNKTLEPGVGASVYGKPPFKVLTGGLNQVDLYFQGAKVRTSSAGNTGKTIILEAADIPQPAPSIDSQMR